MSTPDVTTEPRGQSASPPSLFVRKSSGLVRAFSLRDVLVLNFANINYGLSFSFGTLTVALLFPSASLAGAITIGAAVAVLQAIVYSFLGAAMPRSGGDYVFLSRIIHPAVGFTANFAISFARMILIGLFAAWTVLYGISPALAVLGIQLRDRGLVNAAATVTHKGPLFGIASGIVVLMGLVMMVGPRVMRRIYWAMFVPAFIASPILLGVILYTTSHGAFVSSFNSAMQWLNHNPDNYHAILKGAARAGFVPHAATLAGTIAAIPVGFYLYAGFNDSVYFGGEIKQARRNQPRAIFLGLAITLAVYLVIVIRFEAVLGRSFVGASANYATPLPSGALINFFMGTTQGGIWNWILGIGFTLWVLMLVGVMIMIPIRCMFAWSMDRLVPSALSSVTANGVPWVAAIVSMVTGVIFVAIYNYTQFYTLLANVTVISVLVWGTVAVGGALFPYVAKDLFRQAPEFVQRRVGGIPLITISGALLACLHIGILYYAFKTPAFSGPVSWRSLLFVVLVFAVPASGYFISRAIRRRQGVDLELAFKEIPPE